MTASVQSRGLLVVLSGPSGVGKGTVVARLLRHLPDACLSVSVTTRTARAAETDGDDYHFVDDTEFDRMVESEEFLEWAEYAGARYGTPRRWVEDHLREGEVVLLEIEVQGALQIRTAVPDALLIFLTPPSLDELAARLTRRGTEDDEQRDARLETARRELVQAGAFDHVVVNDDLDTCVKEVADLISARRER